MKYCVVLSNYMGGSLYCRSLRETEGFKYVVILDEEQLLSSDELLFESDNWEKAETFAETHWL